MTAGPYSIGSGCWPGLAKVAEECAEVIQVAGKVIAAGGEAAHWDGSDLRERLEDELADVQAAIWFVTEQNRLDDDRMQRRAEGKLALFRRWHAEHADGSAQLTGSERRG